MDGTSVYRFTYIHRTAVCGVRSPKRREQAGKEGVQAKKKIIHLLLFLDQNNNKKKRKQETPPFPSRSRVCVCSKEGFRLHLLFLFLCLGLVIDLQSHPHPSTTHTYSTAAGSQYWGTGAAAVEPGTILPLNIIYTPIYILFIIHRSHLCSSSPVYH